MPVQGVTTLIAQTPKRQETTRALMRLHLHAGKKKRLMLSLSHSAPTPAGDNSTLPSKLGQSILQSQVGSNVLAGHGPVHHHLRYAVLLHPKVHANLVVKGLR